MAHDVFICYSAPDKPTSDAVCATLEARRIRCWIAPRDVVPGQDYAEALIEAISESRMMVLVFSASSNSSPQVLREVERAASKGIPILPFRIEDVPLSRSMEYFISRTHWLDAFTPPLEKHLEHLAETVRLLLLRAGKPERAGVEPEAPKPAPSVEAAAEVEAEGLEMRQRSADDQRARLISLSQLFGIAALAVGFVILGGVIVRLVQLRGEIPADFVPWFGDIFGDDPARAYHLVLNLIFSVVGLVVGIRLVILGLANVRPIQAPTAGPSAFRSNDEVVHAIRQGEIPSFRPAYSPGSYLFHGLSAGRLAFLPQAARSVFLENAGFFRTAILLLPIVIVVFYFDGYIFSAVDPPPDLTSPAGLLAVISVIVGLKFASCALLTPFSAPSLQAASETQTVTNAGDAATAHSRLKEASQGLAPAGRSARCWEESLALSGGGIADRGTVKGTLLVETEVEPAAPPNPYAGLLLLVAGLFLLPVGILALAHLDVARDPFNSRDTFVRLTLPGALTKTAIFLLCAFYGYQFFGQAKTLLVRLRFRSVAYLLEISGAYGRAAVRVGKAGDDSIESMSVAVSSDLSLTYYGAELLAESAEADSPRDVVAVAAPRGVEQAFKTFEAEINEFADRGVQVQRPELVSPEVLRILRANLGLAAQKREPLESIERGAVVPPAAELPVREEPAASVPSGEPRQCPSCGEEVESGAKFCASCGRELSWGNSAESPPGGGQGESAGESEMKR